MTMKYSMFTQKKIVVMAVFATLFIFLLLLRIYSSPNDEKKTTLAMTQLPNQIETLDNVAEKTEEIKPNQDDQNEQLYVDVKGAVLEPNVYILKDGSRVKDVIKMAGGFLENADQTKINLAARVEDEMVLYVPEMGEDFESKYGDILFKSDQDQEQNININTATAQELQSIPGIGASKAASIISYREKNGPFKEIGDLVNVTGIGEKTVEKFTDQITVR